MRGVSPRRARRSCGCSGAGPAVSAGRWDIEPEGGAAEAGAGVGGIQERGCVTAAVCGVMDWLLGFALGVFVGIYLGFWMLEKATDKGWTVFQRRIER